MIPFHEAAVLASSPSHLRMSKNISRDCSPLGQQPNRFPSGRLSSPEIDCAMDGQIGHSTVTPRLSLCDYCSRKTVTVTKSAVVDREGKWKRKWSRDWREGSRGESVDHTLQPRAQIIHHYVWTAVTSPAAIERDTTCLIHECQYFLRRRFAFSPFVYIHLYSPSNGSNTHTIEK